jgi:hypothetical protein
MERNIFHLWKSHYTPKGQKGKKCRSNKFAWGSEQTAHAVVPVHTSGEFKLFKTMLNSGGFYKKSKGRQLIAANASWSRLCENGTRMDIEGSSSSSRKS